MTRTTGVLLLFLFRFFSSLFIHSDGNYFYLEKQLEDEEELNKNLEKGKQGKFKDEDDVDSEEERKKEEEKKKA